jgi:hypothetical protein
MSEILTAYGCDSGKSKVLRGSPGLAQILQQPMRIIALEAPGG